MGNTLVKELSEVKDSTYHHLAHATQQGNALEKCPEEASAVGWLLNVVVKVAAVVDS